MRVLIVDDDELIVAVMAALIDKYNQESNQELLCEFAYSGEKALEKIKESYYDLIFMDIILPDTTGTAITKEIKKISKKSLVIAISSLGDEEKQSELLSVGAEDYFVKPINTALFLKRLGNYVKLIGSRNKIHSNEKYYNLYTPIIYSYNIFFHIDCEDSLAQVWETLLIRLDLAKRVKNLNDVVRFCYNFGIYQLENRRVFDVIIEEDEKHFYFNIDKISFGSDLNVDEMMKNCQQDVPYTYDNKTLSIVLVKRMELNESQKQEASKEYLKCPNNLVETVNIVQESTKELHIYDFLNSEELNVFEESLDALYLSVENMQIYNLAKDEVILISNSLSKIGTLLALENESFVISESLCMLSKIVESNQDLFIEKAQELATFVLAFLNDLYEWKKMVFVQGAPSIDFMNDSIYSNAKMLESLLVDEIVAIDEVDDIFAF